MPTTKLFDYKTNNLENRNSWIFTQCRNHDHTPNMFLSRTSGFYQHKCSGCGMITVFRIN